MVCADSWHAAVLESMFFFRITDLKWNFPHAGYELMITSQSQDMRFLRCTARTGREAMMACSVSLLKYLILKVMISHMMHKEFDHMASIAI